MVCGSGFRADQRINFGGEKRITVGFYAQSYVELVLEIHSNRNSNHRVRKVVNNGENNQRWRHL
jgi:hypothetical protein